MNTPTPTSPALRTARASVRRNLIAMALVLVPVIACTHGCVLPGGNSGLDAAGVAANNRGVALMGRFDYESALREFEALSQQYPENSDILVNLAIATLNRQKEGDENLALSILEGVLERDPENLRAIYCRGLLKLHIGQPEEALADFNRVAEADPGDADAAFFIGQCLMQMSRYEEALAWYQRSIAEDSYLRSSYYRAFQALQRLRQRDESMAMMQKFQRLEENPRARLVEFKYTKMGRRGDAITLDLAKTPRLEKPTGPVFEAAVPLVATTAGWLAAGAPARASITVADVNGDDGPDLFIAGALEGGDGAANALCLADAGGYTLDRQHPLAGVTAVNAALWGDFDNDGRTDVYLCRRGPNQLWRQVEPGRWQDVTAETQTANGEFNTVDGAIFDADHDGDLDLFLVNADGPNELLNNNRDGTFRPLAAEHGLAGNGKPSRLILLADFDGDRDVDLFVVNAEPPHEVYRNELLWEYRPALGWDAFTAAEVLAAVAGDLDADGRIELYTLDSREVLTRWQRGDGELWEGAALSEPGAGSAEGRLALADVDGDGTVELLVSAGKLWRAGAPDDGKLVPLFTAAEEVATRLAGWTPAVLEPSRGPAVVGWAPGGPPQLWKPGPGRYGFAALTLSGQEDEGAAMRSNASGIGTGVAVRIDSRWTVMGTFRSDSGPGQGLQPVAVGLGGAERMDFVALDWSDGVFQTEMALEQGTLHRITETQRQLSSCPVLFAWNGTGYEFVSDLLGVGGMGYAVGPPGEYAEPRPHENLMLPAGLLQPRDGRLLIKLAEPMEEITYIDAVRLVAYDLPPGWSMTLDERMGLAGPEPSGKPSFYRTIMTPLAAVNDRGDNVTAAVVAADLRAAPVGAFDHRFIGRLAGEHVLTLSFPEAFDAHPGQALLIADGWVEYPYSQTNFAAWQAGADYDAPTVEARGHGGRWRAVLERFGYPAGMPRQMSVPLGALPAGTRDLRVRTNQEIYWDRLAVAFAEPCPEVERHELPLAAARLGRVGFPERTDAAQRLPQYDYSHLLPTWDTRFLKGFYTRLGDVEELVATRDDAVAIFGAGEEIHLEFTATASAPRPGWTRIYVLETEGWCKDMDLYTRDGDTVEPIPHTGLGGPERERLHLAYNTRYLAGRQ